MYQIDNECSPRRPWDNTRAGRVYLFAGLNKDAQGQIMANRNWLSNKMYQMEAYPCLVSCTFEVDPASGTGVSNLTGGAVKAVYMNAAVPSAENPNPVGGVIQIRLQDNYSKLLGVSAIVQEPASGVPLVAVSSGVPYLITSLGTTTLAQWQAVGLPVGVVPAVGVMFVATATQPIGGTGEVQTGLDCQAPEISLAGVANANLQNSNSPVNGGAILTLITRAAGAVTALRTGTVVRVNMYLSNSSITVQGQ